MRGALVAALALAVGGCVSAPADGGAAIADRLTVSVETIPFRQPVFQCAGFCQVFRAGRSVLRLKLRRRRPARQQPVRALVYWMCPGAAAARMDMRACW